VKARRPLTPCAMGRQCSWQPANEVSNEKESFKRGRPLAHDSLRHLLLAKHICSHALYAFSHACGLICCASVVRVMLVPPSVCLSNDAHFGLQSLPSGIAPSPRRPGRSSARLPRRPPRRHSGQERVRGNLHAFGLPRRLHSSEFEKWRLSSGV
jgi:hypothetical protein